MTIYEASERYNIPLEILREYESWGLCGAVKKVMGSWQYDDSDLERLSLIMTLHDIGFASDEIENYMKLLEKGRKPVPSACAYLLKSITPCWMKYISAKKQLDRLNYLRYEIQKEKQQQGLMLRSCKNCRKCGFNKKISV